MDQVVLLDADLLRDQGLYRAAAGALSPGRREKAGRFRFEKDRRLSLGVGVALDWALAAHGLRERDLAQALEPNGKPFFPDLPGLCFNLSHGGHYAVCALARQEVGVDVEPLGRVQDALIRRVCAPGEAEYLLALDPPERDRRFFYLWTVKESYMKLLGTGLRLAPRRLEIGFAHPETIRQDGQPGKAAFLSRYIDGHYLTLCTGQACQPQVRVLTGKDLEERYGVSGK